MEELKPAHCGCGGKVVLRTYGEPETPYCMQCTSCGMTTLGYATETEAVEAWNRAMGERTAKVTLLNTGLHTVWGTCDCGRQVEKPGRNDQSGAYYCPRCGAKLEWE